MSKSFYGSICITDLNEHLKNKHSAFRKGDNGKLYVNVNVWLNDTEDKFGNILSIQIVPHKDKKETEKKHYIGNCKESEFKQVPPSKRDAAEFSDSVDNFDSNPADTVTQPIDDLPF